MEIMAFHQFQNKDRNFAKQLAETFQDLGYIPIITPPSKLGIMVAVRSQFNSEESGSEFKTVMRLNDPGIKFKETGFYEEDTEGRKRHLQQVLDYDRLHPEAEKQRDKNYNKTDARLASRARYRQKQRELLQKARDLGLSLDSPEFK